MLIYFETDVKAPFEKVADGFDIHLFKALKPPLMQLDVLQFDGCKSGDIVRLSMGIGPFKQQWTSVITYDLHTEDSMVFVDEGSALPPPLKGWKHTHKVLRQSQNKTTIVDDIHYTTNHWLLDRIIYPVMYLMFKARKPIYIRYFKN